MTPLLLVIRTLEGLEVLVGRLLALATDAIGDLVEGDVAVQERLIDRRARLRRGDHLVDGGVVLGRSGHDDVQERAVRGGTQRVEVLAGVWPTPAILLRGVVAEPIRIAQRVRQHDALQGDRRTRHPLDEEVRRLLVLAVRGDAEVEAGIVQAVAHRHDRVADFALDGRLRHPAELLGRRSFGPAPDRWPGAADHRDLARHPGGEDLDEAPGLDARRHRLVRIDHARQGVDTGLAVEGGIERRIIEEAPAAIAELL